MPTSRRLTCGTILLAISPSVALASEKISSAGASEPSIWEDARFIAALVAAGVTVIVNILAKPLFDRGLESLRSELELRRARAQSRIEYELSAMKRLHSSIGPLRFQLITAARDAANHVSTHSALKEKYNITLQNYYGRSTMYRLLRPIAICEIIEEEMSYADFSVDEKAIDILRFKSSIVKALSSGTAILDHPEANWHKQEQHLYSQTVTHLVF